LVSISSACTGGEGGEIPVLQILLVEETHHSSLLLPLPPKLLVLVLPLLLLLLLLLLMVSPATVVVFAHLCRLGFLHMTVEDKAPTRAVMALTLDGTRG
jgi:hypothetical protein